MIMVMLLLKTAKPKYLNARLAKASVSRIVVERILKFGDNYGLYSTSGIIIAKAAVVDKLKEELKKITDKDIQINILK